MRRRQFITVLGAAGAAWPVRAWGQQSVPTIGLLGGVSPENYERFVVALLQGLKDTGFNEGENLRVVQLWARGQLDQLPALVRQLADQHVAVLVTVGGTSTALAAKRTSTGIPIVFAVGSDPVEDGLVSSLNRPNDMITGVTFFTNALLAKRLELLAEIVPQASLIGALVNPKNARAARDTHDLTDAAKSIGKTIVFVQASTPDELDTGFAKFASAKTDALLVASDAFFTSRREQLVALAARYGTPTTFGSKEFATAGGLVSYGANVADSHRQAGIYAARILRGAKPADLPIMQPTKFELVINLKTARTLGITVSPTLLARADEVIE